MATLAPMRSRGNQRLRRARAEPTTRLAYKVVSRTGYVHVLVALALVACSHSAPGPLRGAPQAVVRAAADRTMAAGSARVQITIAADMAGTGTVDWHRGSGSFAFARTGARARENQHLDVVTQSATEWLRVTTGSAPASPSDRWVAGAPRDIAARTQAQADPLGTVLLRPGLGTDVAFLRGATKVTAYGGEEVEGVGAYRFTFEVDLAQAIANSPPGDRPALQAAADAIGPVLWPADVWLDAQGRVRRLQMAENPFAHTTTTRANLLITQDGNYLALTNILFDDFGAPTSIAPPPPDEVAP